MKMKNCLEFLCHVSQKGHINNTNGTASRENIGKEEWFTGGRKVDWRRQCGKSHGNF